MSEMPKHPLADLANDVVNHINSDAKSDTPLWDKHYHPGFVSVEADGMTHSGRDEVQKKHDQWFEMHNVYSVKAHPAHLGHNCFSVVIELDAESKDGSWPRMQMQETAHYHVEDGKIVREEFLMPPMGG
ncbi:MAG: SnoaL-like domain-containing protein [Planctomycetota bacterium]